MSFFSSLAADVESIWADIFGKKGATLSATVVDDIHIIGAGLSGALSGFEAVTGMVPATIAEIQKIIGEISTSAGSVVATMETNAALGPVQGIVADFNSLKTALQGVTLPAVLTSVINAVTVLLPYIEAGVGILTATTVGAAQEVGMSADEARLVLKGA